MWTRVWGGCGCAEGWMGRREEMWWMGLGKSVRRKFEDGKKTEIGRSSGCLRWIMGLVCDWEYL